MILTQEKREREAAAAKEREAALEKEREAAVAQQRELLAQAQAQRELLAQAQVREACRMQGHACRYNIVHCLIVSYILVVRGSVQWGGVAVRRCTS